jgi:hypothetical protein
MIGSRSSSHNDENLRRTLQEYHDSLKLVNSVFGKLVHSISATLDKDQIFQQVVTYLDRKLVREDSSSLDNYE